PESGAERRQHVPGAPAARAEDERVPEPPLVLGVRERERGPSVVCPGAGPGLLRLRPPALARAELGHGARLAEPRMARDRLCELARGERVPGALGGGEERGPVA